MTRTEFTVIVTCYNDEDKVIKFLKNVLEQSIQPLEYIIVDGGSTDSTVALINKYRIENKLPIRLFEGERLNIAQGYNVGINYAKTDILIICGIGNYYDKKFFQSLIEYYEINNSEIIYGQTLGCGNTYFSKIYIKMYVGGEKGVHPLPTNRGQLVKKDIFRRIGFFYEKLIYAGEDVEFVNHAKDNNVKIGFTDKAKLYWLVPRNFKEYVKQKNVYFIGSLQIDKNRLLPIIKSFFYLTILILFIVVSVYFYKTIFPYLTLLVFYSTLSFRMRSLNPIGVFLKTFDLLSPFLFFILYSKYIKKKYRVKR